MEELGKWRWTCGSFDWKAEREIGCLNGGIEQLVVTPAIEFLQHHCFRTLKDTSNGNPSSYPSLTGTFSYNKNPELSWELQLRTVKYFC